MTIRQEKTLRELPLNDFNISKSMRKAGFKDSTSKSGQQYKRIQKHAIEQGIYNPEKIEEDEKLLWAMSQKAGDITNLNRQLEGRRKVAGMITDKSEVLKTPDTIVIVDKSYRQGLSTTELPSTSPTINDNQKEGIIPQPSKDNATQDIVERSAGIVGDGKESVIGDTPTPPLGKIK